MQSDYLKQRMDQTKDMVLNRILLVLFFFMALGLTISLLRVPETGFKLIYGIQMLQAVIMVFLYLGRNKMKTVVRGGVFLFVIYAMGISSVLSFGIYGFGWAYFIPASAMAFLYFNRKTGWALSIMNFVILAGTAFLYSKGILEFSPANPGSVQGFANWLNMIITTLLITIVIVLFWNNLYGLVSNTFTHIYNQQEDMKKMNEELQVAKELAEQSDKLKSSFLQNISHEIRTPLNIIIGFSDMVSQTEDPQQQAEFNQVIRDNCNSMLKIVNDIVDFSKIETDTLNLNPTKFNIKEVLENLEKKFKFVIKEEINFEMDKLDLEIDGDKDRFQQILNNLLENAFKFTQEGNIALQCQQEENNLHFKIIDTGIGIPAEEHEKIFERFYRIDAFSGGAGLGLSISKSIANKMGGDVKVFSEVGKGSTFEVKLPIMN